MLKELGVGLIIFGVITLINFYDTYSKISESARILERYGYSSAVNMGILSILTWLGIAVTQFVLGIVLYSLDTDDTLPQPEGKLEPIRKPSQPRESSKSLGNAVTVAVISCAVVILAICFYCFITGFPT